MDALIIPLFGCRKSPAALTRFLLHACFLVLPVASSALHAAGADEKTGRSADADWQSLKDLGRPAAGGRMEAAKIDARGALVAKLVDDAARLREFYTKHPEHTAAWQAKCLEALALVFAWQAGDEANDARRQNAVAAIRTDGTIPAAERAEVAGLFENVAVEKRRDLSAAGRLSAYEEVARKLAAEFPDLPDAYEALVHIANDSPDERAPVIAADVADMEKAPAWVKREARTIDQRYGLIGKRAAEQTTRAIAIDNPFVKAAGRPLVIYTWATFHPPSITRAKELPTVVPEGTTLIGICLDQRDLNPAKALAGAEGLPGEQIFDWLGRRGEIAEALAAIEPGLVYAVDSDGIIRSVSAQRDLQAAMAMIAAQ